MNIRVSVQCHINFSLQRKSISCLLFFIVAIYSEIRICFRLSSLPAVLNTGTHSWIKASKWHSKSQCNLQSMIQAKEAAATRGMLFPWWRTGGQEVRPNHANTFQASAGMWLRSCPLKFHWPK